MIIKSTLAYGLQKCVGNLWKGDDFSDFTIVVEDTSFSCHRFILSACSGFFQGLFRSEMKESREGLAKLDKMSQEIFEIIINSIYKGTDGLTEDTVLDVLFATQLLQIDYLIEECKQFVIDNLSVDNCFRFLNQAMAFSAQDVMDSCLDFIIKNFEQVRNVESFLQLTPDCFYKVIGSDILATSSEDLVVDAILTWMEYQPDPEHCSWLYTETLDEKAADETLPVADISSYSLAIKGSEEIRDDDRGNDNIGQDNEISNQETGNDDQENGANFIIKKTIDQSEAFVISNDENSSISECCENKVDRKPHIMTSGGNTTMYNKNRACQTNSKDADRTHHFLKLISACRLFIAKPTCLKNLLKNHKAVLISTGVYDLVLNALMYSVSVDLRHETWPEAAVHRASSSFKHVMVFLSGNHFKAYSLDTGSVHEFAKVPGDHSYSNKIIVFDNGLYFVYSSTDRHHRFSMITKQKCWAPVTDVNMYYSPMLLAHGNYVYDVDVDVSQFTLSRWSYAHGHSKWMTQIYDGYVGGNNIIRFQLYIVVFTKDNGVVTAHCFNTETNEVHVCTTSMDETSQSKISFSRNEDVYVLQGNGSLWKVVSTDTVPVDFVLISNIWDVKYDLKGCVLYRKKLYIFHDNMDTAIFSTVQKPDYITLPTSLPGICEDIRMIYIESKTQVLPMVLPVSWLTS